MIRRYIKLRALEGQYKRLLILVRDSDITPKAEYLTNCAINNIAHEYNAMRFMFYKRLKYAIEMKVKETREG